MNEIKETYDNLHIKTRAAKKSVKMKKNPDKKHNSKLEKKLLSKNTKF